MALLLPALLPAVLTRLAGSVTAALTDAVEAATTDVSGLHTALPALAGAGGVEGGFSGGQQEHSPGKAAEKEIAIQGRCDEQTCTICIIQIQCSRAHSIFKAKSRGLASLRLCVWNPGKPNCRKWCVLCELRIYTPTQHTAPIE